MFTYENYTSYDIIEMIEELIKDAGKAGYTNMIQPGALEGMKEGILYLDCVCQNDRNAEYFRDTFRVLAHMAYLHQCGYIRREAVVE